MKLTTIILARNESGNIARAIRSVSFCDEVIVVNDNSTDDTVEIAKKEGARVLTIPVGVNFADARNRVESASTGDWILHIDADEEVTPGLATQIRRVVDDNASYLVYRIRRSDFFWGRELRHGETRSARTKGIIRLHKKGVGKWTGIVHEVYKPSVMTDTLHGYLHHYPHPTVREFLESVNFYSSLRAAELRGKNRTIIFMQLLFFPPLKFFYTYFIKLGFLDGPAGFAYAFFMSFHSFLTRAKVYTGNR